jgi:hypothetical protein
MRQRHRRMRQHRQQRHRQIRQRHRRKRQHLRSIVTKLNFGQENFSDQFSASNFSQISTYKYTCTNITEYYG